jgi:hypothetical protein
VRTSIIAAVVLTLININAGTVPAPERVKVLPVFLVPKDQMAPTRDQRDRFIRHLQWARARFAQLLPEANTFEFAKTEPSVYSAPWPLLAYRALPEDGAPQFASELLRHYNENRFTCPYIFVIILMNPCEGRPAGGGRPVNGAQNRGGGIVILSSYALDHSTNFQSTLQHELGHSFGLPHSDVYGYSLTDSDSMMSYNPKHHTRGFEPSANPALLIEEDRRALAINQRVFPGLKWETNRTAQLPAIVSFPPMIIPDEANYPDDHIGLFERETGYFLFEGGTWILAEPAWNREQATKDLRKREAVEPSRFLARHNGEVLYADSAGYELFRNGQRIRHESSWSLEDALADILRDRDKKNRNSDYGRFGGVRILFAEAKGYELFWDGFRVGYEPSWNPQQAADNLEWNRKTQPNKIVEGRFDGVRLP